MAATRRLLPVLVAAVIGFTASPASAHVEFLSSNPIAGTTVTVPQTITLTFSEPPLDLGAAVVLVDGAGMSHAADISVSGSRLSAVWPNGLEPGLITARWRVTADDGHVLQGSLSFTFRPVGGVGPSAAEEQLVLGSATTTPGALGPAPSDTDFTWWVLGCVLLITSASFLYLFSARRP